jgi:hypothetical protein
MCIGTACSQNYFGAHLPSSSEGKKYILLLFLGMFVAYSSLVKKVVSDTWLHPVLCFKDSVCLVVNNFRGDANKGLHNFFYVLFTVHFDNIQQLNQQMHFIS